MHFSPFLSWTLWDLMGQKELSTLWRADDLSLQGELMGSLHAALLSCRNAFTDMSLLILWYICIGLVFFGSITQEDFMLARQALYCLSHASRLFAQVILEIKSRLGHLDRDLPILCFLLLSRWQEHTNIPSFFPLSWGLKNFFALAGLKLQSSWSQSPK
jgi:hypothetical protein